jgi:hypothetical protein
MNNMTFDFLLIRNENNEDTKGLWILEMIDESFSTLELSSVISGNQDRNMF